MSTYASLANTLTYRLGNRTDLGLTTDASARIHEFLFAGSVELAHRLKGLGVRIPQLESRFDYVIPANTDDVTYATLLASGRLYAIVDIVNRTGEIPMNFSAIEAFEKTRADGATGSADQVTLWTSYNRVLSVWRKPTENTTVRILSYLDPAAITAPSSQSPEVGVSYEAGLLLLAESFAWDSLDNEEKADSAEAKFDRWITRKRAPTEHERRNPRTRGLRPHPAMIRDHDLGI